VHLYGLNPELRATVESFIQNKWPTVTIDETNENARAQERSVRDARLVIANSRTPAAELGTNSSETILVNGELPEQVLFLVNAKLGRLTNSNLGAADQQSSITSPLSRREFLFRMLRRTPPPIDAPVVLADACEARFGCRKCVDMCPAPGALEVQANALVVSAERCVRCGLCAGVCPVAAIQVPEMTEDAYRGLLKAIDDWPAPKKTLVITCNESSVPKQPWMDVEEVHEIGVIGVRQLAMAASTSISATIIYCPDGLCVAKDHVKRAADLLTSLNKTSPPSVFYLEGRDGTFEIERIHHSARKRVGAYELDVNPRKAYVNAIQNLSVDGARAVGLWFTDLQVAESCTLCNACVDKCPHKALAIEEGSLLFDTGECTGCGYCEQICPEHSITLLENEGTLSIAQKSVYRDEMVKCSKCNTPFASAKMVRKVSGLLQSDAMMTICPSCREKGMYDELFRKTTSSGST